MLVGNVFDIESVGTVHVCVRVYIFTLTVPQRPALHPVRMVVSVVMVLVIVLLVTMEVTANTLVSVMYYGHT